MDKIAQEKVREESLRMYDKLMSDDIGLHKSAQEDLTEYTRIQNREGSFASRILEPIPFTRDMVVPQMHTDHVVVLFDYEPDSPFAYTVDYSTTEANFVPRGRRYPLQITMEKTKEVAIDLMELQSYKYDLRAVLADNMTKDLVARRDYRLLNAVRGILGPVDTVLPWVGKAMHVNLGSALTHSAWARAQNVMRDTHFNIEATKVLMSNLRRADFTAIIHEDRKGVNAVVDLQRDGWSETNYDGLQLLFTTKRNWVPYNDFFYFGPEQHLGRYVHMFEPTMSLERKATQIQFFLYEAYGMTIAHPGAVAICRYL